MADVPPEADGEPKRVKHDAAEAHAKPAHSDDDWIAWGYYKVRPTHCGRSPSQLDVRMRISVAQLKENTRREAKDSALLSLLILIDRERDAYPGMIVGDQTIYALRQVKDLKAAKYPVPRWGTS